MKPLLLLTILAWVTGSLAAPNPGPNKYGEKTKEEEQLDQLRHLKGTNEVGIGAREEELRHLKHPAGGSRIQPPNAMSKFAGIQYSPADLAEYILRTGDEEGVALAVEELYKEGLIDRSEAVEYLQAVKDVINYLQDVQHEQDITKEISPGRSDIPAMKLKRPMNQQLDDSQVDLPAADYVPPHFQAQVKADISARPTPSSMSSTTEVVSSVSSPLPSRKTNLTAVNEVASTAASVSLKSKEVKSQGNKKEENKTAPESPSSSFRHMKPGNVPSNFEASDKRANHPMSPHSYPEESTGHSLQPDHVEDVHGLGPRHPHQSSHNQGDPLTGPASHQQVDSLPPRHPNFQGSGNPRGYPQVKPVPQFMEAGSGADLRVFDPKELIAQQMESEAAAEGLYRPKQIFTPRLDEVDELERYRTKQLLERLRPYMPVPDAEMEEKLRTVNSLYQEYTLEEVIYQLARNMFAQSLAQGDPSAEESLNKLVNFMEDEVAKKRISPEMKERILEIMSAALVETLKEYPAPVRNDPLQPYQPQVAELQPPPAPRPLPHTLNTKPKPNVSNPMATKKVKFMNKKSPQHD